MRKTTLILLALILMLAVPSQAGEWMIDKAHSAVEFSVRHLTISKIKGEFHDFDGKLIFDGKNLKDGAAEVTIQVASIDTDNADRDNHLRSGDFFSAEEHPSISFKSKKVADIKDSKFKLVGDLTIHGVTKEVTFECELHGVVTGPMGKTRAGFTAETTINRQDFNVSWSKALDSGGLVVGNDVNLVLDLEFVEANKG